MFVKFIEAIRKYHLEYFEHGFDVDTLKQVYLKTKDNTKPRYYYLIKIERESDYVWSNNDFVKEYNDIVVYQHTDCPILSEEYPEYEGYAWMNGDDQVEEIVGDNNATFKFLLKK